MLPTNTAVLTIAADADTQRISSILIVYRKGEVEMLPLSMSEVICQSATSSSLVFTWEDVLGASGYKVSLDGGNTYSDLLTHTNYSWTDLDPNQEYTIYVKAVGNGNNTLDSDPVSATATTLPSIVVTYPVTDVLNKDYTLSSYGDWLGKTSNSPAVYAGNTSGGDNYIQMRSSNSSGIVTTSSGGYASRIVVKWNAKTAGGRTLDIYGKSEAYTSSAQLYDSKAKGTKLGSIVYGTSTELEIVGDYAFIGLRSNDGAMYIDEIQITWVEGN